MKLRFFLLTVFFSIAFLSFSLDVSTPRKSVNNFLYFTSDDHYDLERASKSLYKEGLSKKEQLKNARLLQEIFDGSGVLIDIEDLPNTPTFVDSTLGDPIVVVNYQFPNIYVQRYGEKWLFSEESVAALKTIHKSIYPFGSSILMNLLPKSGNQTLWGLHMWQYFGIMICLIAAFLIHFFLTFLINKFLATVLIKLGHVNIAKNHLIPLSKPISLSAVFWLLSILTPILQLPHKSGAFVIIGLKGAIPIFWTIIIYRFADLIALFMEKRAAKTASTLDDQLVPLVRKALKTFVVIVGSLYVLQNFNVNITTLLAGLSIGGLAFALAAQDTIKNFFGSLMIFLDKPFQVGDWVVGNGIDGTIEEVGFRATRIRTFHNSLTYIPNGNIADMTIDNMGKRHYRRYKTTLGLTYDTPPHKMEAFVAGLEKIVLTHPHTKKKDYHIYFHEYGDFALKVLFYIFIDTPTWGQELKTRHDLNIAIQKLADETGVSFAFPTQTVHLANSENSLS